MSFPDTVCQFGHPALETGEGGWQGLSVAQKFLPQAAVYLVEIGVWGFSTGAPGNTTIRCRPFADDFGGSNPGSTLGAVGADLAVTNTGSPSVWRSRLPAPILMNPAAPVWLAAGIDTGAGSNVNLYTGSPGTSGIQFLAGSTLAAGNWAGTSDGARGPLSIYGITVPDPATQFEGGFETGDLNEWDASFQAAAGRFTAVTNDAGVTPRSGSYMGRVEVRSGDDPTGSGGNECQVYRIATVPTHFDVNGDDRFYAFSVYLPPGFGFVPGSLFNYIFESHGDFGVGQAPLKLGINDIISGPNPRTSFMVELETGASPTVPTQTIFRLGDLITGRWVDFVLHVKWAQTATGVIEAWMNGKQVVSQSGIQTWYTAGMNTARPQLGYYRSAAVNTIVLYVDSFRSGSTFSSVSLPAGSGGAVAGFTRDDRFLRFTR